jgi:hypothetical protein
MFFADWLVYSGIHVTLIFIFQAVWTTSYHTFDTGFFFRDASMAYILFIGYMRLSTHLVLHILSNPRIYIVVLLYKSLSNPNISIGLYWVFFLSHKLIVTCVLSMYGCVYFYVVHTLNSVTKRSNTQLPWSWGIDLKTHREWLKRKKIDVFFYLKQTCFFVFVCR